PPLDVPGVGKIARHEDIEITVLVEIGDFGAGSSVQGEEEAFAEVIPAIVLQDPNSVIRLQYTRVVQVVPIHVDDVCVPVAVEVVQGEVHRSINGWESCEEARPLREVSFPVVLEQD